MRWKALKTMWWGVFWIAGAVWFWLEAAGNPITDLRLALSGRVAPGHVIGAWENAEDTDFGQTSWSHSIAYSFKLPDGSEIKAGYRGGGRLLPAFVDLKQPVPVEVEYLPSSPSDNRVKGYGSQSFGDWLWRKVGLGGFLLAMFLRPGATLLREGFAKLRFSSKDHCSSGDRITTGQAEAQGPSPVDGELARANGSSASDSS